MHIIYISVTYNVIFLLYISVCYNDIYTTKCYSIYAELNFNVYVFYIKCLKIFALGSSNLCRVNDKIIFEIYFVDDDHAISFIFGKYSCSIIR